MAPWTGRFLGLLLLADHLILLTACNEAYYSYLIQHICLEAYKFQMTDIGQRLWCDWEATASSYRDLTNCTYLIANKMDCFWPNQAVDQFFVTIHTEYFVNCSVSGRALGDPPNNIIGPFIVVPVMITLLITSLVVWRSKRNEGIV
ncbi:receptor activity-modifying protein 1 isoform X1 [Scyliorhinus torazame]|uniref:receptor activity-modifying protein 1 isoform X1 n=1 Tax=Scyliorhinus torazame TaxID=75743 RepID=UPI003B5AAA31